MPLPDLRLSASMTAWPAHRFAEGIEVLRNHGFTGVELVPTAVWGEPARWTKAMARATANRLADQGMSVSALTSVMFGAEGADLFTAPSRMIFRDRMLRVLDMAAATGTRTVAYSAVASRRLKPGVVCDDSMSTIEFLATIADEATSRGCVIAMAPAGRDVGPVFGPSHRSVADIVCTVGRPGLRVLANTGAAASARETWPSIANAGILPIIAHAHLSDGVGQQQADIGGGIYALIEDGYQGWLSATTRTGDDWREELATVLGRVLALSVAAADAVAGRTRAIPKRHAKATPSAPRERVAA